MKRFHPLGARPLSSILVATALLATPAPAREPRDAPSDLSPFGESQRVEPYAWEHDYFIGPIEGFTVDWHAVPERTWIPLGTVVQLTRWADPEDSVLWEGALEHTRDALGSTAECRFDALGPHLVSVHVEEADGSASTRTTEFVVVDYPVEEIRFGELRLRSGSVEASGPKAEESDEPPHTWGSVASVRRLGDGSYLTSVGRVLDATVAVEPAGFAPLIEWRLDGIPASLPLGATSQLYLDDTVGNRRLTVHAPGRESGATVRTYSTQLELLTEIPDVIPDGMELRFRATTHPPGLEEQVRWLATAMPGVPVPTHGTGTTFSVRYYDTWGEHGQWVGVQADDAAFSHDGGKGVGSADSITCSSTAECGVETSASIECRDAGAATCFCSGIDGRAECFCAGGGEAASCEQECCDDSSASTSCPPGSTATCFCSEIGSPQAEAQCS